jgi:hypothetical protein
VPEEAQKDAARQPRLRHETFRIELDESKGSRKLKLTNKQDRRPPHLRRRGEHGHARGRRRRSRIKAVGAISLEATQVTIAGRVVRPIAEPI